MRSSTRKKLTGPAIGQIDTEEVDTLATGIISGDRRLLARAISLVESTRTNHRLLAESLLNKILPNRRHALRLGISGVPGVGKSTFIQAAFGAKNAGL